MGAGCGRRTVARHEVDGARTLAVLCAIVALAAALRLYGLGAQSLWVDEVATLRFARLPDLWTVVDQGARPEVNPPGLHVVAHLALRLLGDSEAALRLPSAASGIASVVLVYLIGARLLSRREGLLAAAIMAVAWCPVYYSQEARVNSMAVLAALASQYLWLGMALPLGRGRAPPAGVLAGYAASAVALAYLHYFGLILVAVQALGALALAWGRPRSLARVLAAYLAASLAYLPWVPVILEQLAHGHGYGWVTTTPGLARALGQLLYFFLGRSMPVLAAAGLLYAHLVLRWVRERDRVGRERRLASVLLEPEPMLVLWLVAPFLAAYLASVLVRPMMEPRNLMVSLPAAYLLLARSVERLPLARRGRDALGAAIVAVLLAHLVIGIGYYTTPQKEQIREAVAYVVANDSRYPGATIIGFTWGTEPFDYYLERMGSARRFELSGGTAEDIPAVSEALARARPRHLWYVRAHREPDPAFFDALARGRTLVDHRAFLGADVWLFEDPSAGGVGARQEKDL